MRAGFSEFFLKKEEETDIYKKTIIRTVSLCLVTALFFSIISYKILDWYDVYLGSAEYFLLHVVITSGCVLLGSICSIFCFSNILKHLKKILYQLSDKNPDWPDLEREYMEKDVHHLYSSVRKLHDTVASQATLAAIGETARKVAHDIRGPLTSMETAHMMLSSAVQRTTTKDEEMVEGLDLLGRSSKRLEGIANTLLEKKAKEEKHKKKLVSIHHVLDDLLGEYLEQKKRYPHLQIVKKYPIDALYVMGDKVSLGRAFGNVIKNAVEAMGTTWDMRHETCEEKDGSPDMGHAKKETWDTQHETVSKKDSKMLTGGREASDVSSLPTHVPCPMSHVSCRYLDNLDVGL